jgi:site-specific recombinase XerD
MPVPSKFYLFRRANGFYYVGYHADGRKRWKSTGCTTKHEALRIIRNLPDLFREKPPAVTLSEFTSDFLKHADSIYTPGNVVLYEYALAYFREVAGDIALGAVTQKHVDEFKASRLAVGRSAVTVNREVRSLRAAFSFAVRWQLIGSNPFSGVQLVKVPDRLPTFLSRDDFQKLFGMIKENWLRELVFFAVSTGLRRGEMINLRWQDVDLGRRVMHIQSAGNFRTKDGRRRTLPLSDSVHTFLSSKAPRQICEFVFHRRGFKIGENYLSARFKFYVAEAGLDGRLHWHSLRHTHASWLVQDGVSLFQVQQLLGHADSRTTEIYSHLRPETMQETVNRIGIRLN